VSDAPDDPAVAPEAPAVAELERLLRYAHADLAARAEELAAARDELAASRRMLTGALADAVADARQREALVAEIDALRATKTFRYTEGLRRAYGSLRRR
jgi:hypothetical protein